MDARVFLMERLRVCGQLFFAGAGAHSFCVRNGKRSRPWEALTFELKLLSVIRARWAFRRCQPPS